MVRLDARRFAQVEWNSISKVISVCCSSKKAFLTIIALCMLISSSLGAEQTRKTTFDGRFAGKCPIRPAGQHREICNISFYKLISSPEKYDGKLVSVTGYLVNVFGRPVLFPSKASYDGDIQIEGIELVGSFNMDKEISGKIADGLFPVVVVGDFDGRYAGSDVRRLGAFRHIIGVAFSPRIPEH